MGRLEQRVVEHHVLPVMLLLRWRHSQHRGSHDIAKVDLTMQVCVRLQHQRYIIVWIGLDGVEGLEQRGVMQATLHLLVVLQ